MCTRCVRITDTDDDHDIKKLNIDFVIDNVRPCASFGSVYLVAFSLIIKSNCFFVCFCAVMVTDTLCTTII